MNTTTILRYTVGYVVTAALGAVIGGSVAANHQPSPSGADQSSGIVQTTTRKIGHQPARFTMRGRIAHLVPGTATTLRIRISNPNKWPIKVLTIHVAAQNASPRCRARGNLWIGPYDPARRHTHPATIPSHRTALAYLRVALENAPHRNQNACKRAVFRLRYTGTAHRVKKQG